MHGRIQVNKEVIKIKWDKGSKIDVECADTSKFQADHVIVTVSLGVLKNRFSSLFTPEIPVEKREAIEKIGFGAVGKIFLSFDEKFWPDDCVGFSLLWTTEDLELIRGTEKAW